LAEVMMDKASKNDILKYYIMGVVGEIKDKYR
jgi:hypothetical protein